MKKQEIVRTIKCPYEAYKYFCTKFGRDPALELKDMRKKFYRIRCPNLKDYIHSFEVPLAEYTAAGGNPEEISLYDAFLDQIKDEKYRLFKMMFKGNSLTEALDYFRDLADREGTI